MSLAGIVHDAIHNDYGSENEKSNPRAKAIARRLAVPQHSGTKRRSSGYGSAPGSPAGRTGPPSSSFPISPSYSGGKGKGRTQTEESPGNSLPPSRMNSQGDPINANAVASDNEDAEPADPYRKNFVRSHSGFRSAWEYEDQDSSAAGRNKRQRDSWLDPEAWNPIKWLGLTEVEKEDDGAADSGDKNGDKKQSEEKQTEESPRIEEDQPTRTESPQNTPDESEATKAESTQPALTKASRAPRQFSLSSMKPGIKSAPTWTRLKALLPQVVGAPNEHTNATIEREKKKRDIDVVYELTYAGLAPLVLRMWFERDERDERRVPILMHQLKVRVGDSIHPLSSSKAVFRIECEYANGAARWVLYRQLRDFRKLNRHYRVANFYTMSDVKLPDFPLSAINKMHFYRMKREKGSMAARAEFAKMQRQALENYIVGLIRAVVSILFLLYNYLDIFVRCLRQVPIASLAFWKFLPCQSLWRIVVVLNTKQAY